MRSKYLSYITPIKPKTTNTNPFGLESLDIPTLKLFSAMVIETMDIVGKEIPICISIRTRNSSKLFLIDHLLLESNLNLARILSNLWDNFFYFKKKFSIFTKNISFLK